MHCSIHQHGSSDVRCKPSIYSNSGWHPLQLFVTPGIYLFRNRSEVDILLANQKKSLPLETKMRSERGNLWPPCFLFPSSVKNQFYSYFSEVVDLVSRVTPAMTGFAIFVSIQVQQIFYERSLLQYYKVLPLPLNEKC